MEEQKRGLYLPLSLIEHFCARIGVEFTSYQKGNSNEKLCDSILLHSTGNSYFFRDYSVDFEGLTLIKSHTIEMHVLTDKTGFVPGNIFLHELGHVIDYFQITNSRTADSRALETIKHAEAALVERIGKSAFGYLCETVADYYAILIAALIDINTNMRLSVLKKTLESYQQEDQHKSETELMFDQFYLDSNPTELAKINDPLHYYRYIMQRIRTTEELFTHVNYCLKYTMLTGFEGLKKEMDIYFPYIRDYCGKEIAVIDFFGKLESFSDTLLEKDARQ